MLIRADLGVMEDIEAMFRQLRSEFNRLDILVNNASEFAPATIDQTTPEEWDRQMAANAKGPFFVAQHAARMMAGGSGKIVNIVDVAGEIIWPRYFPYSISKAALIAVTKGMAKSYAPDIQVNGVAPGPVLFPENYSLSQKTAAIDRTLLKRQGSAEDVVRAILFLIEHDYITGEILRVDGGRHLI
jgi:pteridine reductase